MPKIDFSMFSHEVTPAKFVFPTFKYLCLYGGEALRAHGGSGTSVTNVDASSNLVYLPGAVYDVVGYRTASEDDENVTAVGVSSDGRVLTRLTFKTATSSYPKFDYLKSLKDALFVGYEQKLRRVLRNFLGGTLGGGTSNAFLVEIPAEHQGIFNKYHPMVFAEVASFYRDSDDDLHVVMQMVSATGGRGWGGAESVPTVTVDGVAVSVLAYHGTFFMDIEVNYLVERLLQPSSIGGMYAVMKVDFDTDASTNLEFTLHGVAYSFPVLGSGGLFDAYGVQTLFEYSLSDGKILFTVESAFFTYTPSGGGPFDPDLAASAKGSVRVSREVNTSKFYSPFVSTVNKLVLLANEYSMLDVRSIIHSTIDEVASFTGSTGINRSLSIQALQGHGAWGSFGKEGGGSIYVIKLFRIDFGESGPSITLFSPSVPYVVDSSPDTVQTKVLGGGEMRDGAILSVSYDGSFHTDVTFPSDYYSSGTTVDLKSIRALRHHDTGVSMEFAGDGLTSAANYVVKKGGDVLVSGTPLVHTPPVPVQDTLGPQTVYLTVGGSPLYDPAYAKAAADGRQLRYWAPSVISEVPGEDSVDLSGTGGVMSVGSSPSAPRQGFVFWRDAGGTGAHGLLIFTLPLVTDTGYTTTQDYGRYMQTRALLFSYTLSSKTEYLAWKAFWLSSVVTQYSSAGFSSFTASMASQISAIDLAIASQESSPSGLVWSSLSSLLTALRNTVVTQYRSLRTVVYNNFASNEFIDAAPLGSTVLLGAGLRIVD